MAKVARSELAMTDEACDAFLASHQWARVATVSPEGEPTVSPIGYAVVDGHLWFYAGARGRRAKDIEAGSRVCMCIDDGVGPGQGYADRRGAVVYGTARVVADDDPILDRVRPLYAQAMFGDSSVDFRRRTHVWFDVAPYRRTSWDFGRIPQGADRFA